MKQGKCLAIIDRSFSHKIPVCKILYLKQELRYVKIVTEDDSVYIRGKVDDYLSKLPEEFVKSHSYCIINMARVYKMGEDTVIFDKGQRISLGHSSFLATRKVFNEYIKSLI